jgi:predicted nucleic acid-binding protein
MTAQYFIDTNFLLYAGSGASEDQAKKAIARQLLAQADIGFSAQVMQEFYYAAARKERLKITHDEVVLILEALSPFPVLPVDREMVLEAVELTVGYKISYWDAAIIAAARRLGCDILSSEDLSHGQDYGGIKVVNPFLAVAS